MEEYMIMPKGAFLGWLLNNQERLNAALDNDESLEPFERCWEEICEIFGLDNTGENIELAFTRDFIVRHDLMYALASAWDKYKKKQKV